jgi:hypothetical protein
MIIRHPPRLTNKTAFLRFIEVDLWSWLRDLSIALTMVSFKSNFQSFFAEKIVIPAGQEVAITNMFFLKKQGKIPSGRIIVRQTGDANIIDGATAWTDKLVYLRNPSANNAVVSVVFYL